MIAFSDIVPLINFPIAPEDYELLVDADAGDADAQNDLSQLLMDVDRLEQGIYWLKLAVDQEHADAMHNFAKLHFSGTGVPKDDNIGLMWLSKASAHGHVIARRQMDALVSWNR